jgi:hypothetical protein
MLLKTTRHATMTPPQHLPQPTLPQTQPPHDHNCTTKKQQGRKTRSLACVKHAHKSQTLLTKPKATITTPLLNPATDTGVYRSVVVLSPTCASETKSRQTETCLPSPANHQPHQKKTSQSITCPKAFHPQHDTPPLLDSAQE